MNCSQKNQAKGCVYEDQLFADRVFPWQRRERVVEFNREARVAAEAAGGRFVDLAPATEGARATSDGVHYLTAVNLVKARIFIALLHMSHDTLSST